MFALDLFNTRYERQLQEGGVDNLEARRIDDLNMRMLELLDRAKEPAYKKNPAALAGLKKQFQQVKDERDSYFKIKEELSGDELNQRMAQLGKDASAGIKQSINRQSDARIAALKNPPKEKSFMQQVGDKQIGMVKGVWKGLTGGIEETGIPGNVPTEKIPGKEDLLKGKGRTYYEGEADQPTAGQSPRAYGAANFQRLVKANMGNLPTVSLEFANPKENFKLDQKGLDLISDYYDGLADDQAKNYFIYHVLSNSAATLNVLKQLGWTLQLPLQGELPLQEKKKSDDDLEAGDVKVARELQKLRARYPAVRSDIEAVASAEIDSTERSQQQLAAIRGANQKQDALLKQLVDLDKEQGREIDGLDQENNSLEQRLAQVQATNDRLQQTVGRMTGTKKAAVKTKTTAPQGSRDIARGGIIDVGASVAPVAPMATTTSPAVAPPMARQTAGTAPETDSDVIQRPSKLRVLRPAVATNTDEFKLTGTESKIKEHGGGIGPKQHWQDLMPEQSNTDDDWYDDEDSETELRSGDYVRDTMDGESGEVFRMQGDPYERRVRILDRDGKGWYIEPSRLTRVDSQDPDIQLYFGKKRQRDMDESGVAEESIGNIPQSVKMLQHIKNELDQYVRQKGAPGGQRLANNLHPLLVQLNKENEKDLVLSIQGMMQAAERSDRSTKGLSWGMFAQELSKKIPELIRKRTTQGVAEGWSDAIVAQRTGQPRTPYSVYIKGRKWKDFENEDLAQAVMNKLKAKFKADGRDPETVTIAPTNMTETVKEPTTRQELLNRVDKIQRMMSQERNPANLQIMRKELEMLKQRYQHLREDNDSEAVERAILNRIMVAHTDLLMKYGPDKVMQAAEEVSYNVGDVDEIGTSDVSAYVAQVKQILGAVAESKLDEKWSAKYKSSINCANPKGFSQKAHCAGKKK
jgi:hypothetical protein